MNTPDTVGGLPEPVEYQYRYVGCEWQRCGKTYYETLLKHPYDRATLDRMEVRALHDADQLRAYGELCRAAPAGGDYRGVIPQALEETINGVVSDLEVIAAGKDQVTGDPVSGLQSQRIAKSALGRLLAAWNACDSAPAGSGEIEDEDAYVIEQMGRLLAEIAVIVNGPEPADTRWSYHDLPEKVALLRKLQQGADTNV